jgi:hypothetical protein
VRTALVVAVVSAAMILVPILQRPAMAQQSWGPTPGYAPGQPYYAPPPVDAAGATNQAINDAHADTNGALWFFAGCLLTWIGVVIAYVAEPSPPPARLLGKSPEYLAIYTTAYKAEGKSSQGRAALWGAATTLVVVIVLWVVIVVSVTHQSTAYGTAAAVGP